MSSKWAGITFSNHSKPTLPLWEPGDLHLQCFGWFKWPDGEFTGVLRDNVVSLRNHTEHVAAVEFCCHKGEPDAVLPLLQDLFRTNVRPLCDAPDARTYTVANY